MSAFTIPGLRKALVHAKHAGQTPTELKQRIAELVEETGVLAADCSTFNDDMVRSIIRGCQDAMALAVALDENEQLKVRVRQLGDKVIRSAAEQERLRQAVINARPRITYTVQALDRPYVSHVQVPYPVPTGQDTSNETTQNIPLVDLPQQREAL